MNIIVLVGQGEDKIWTFTCPDIPGLSGRARDRAAVSRSAAEQVGAHVRGLAGAQRVLPSARTLDQLNQDAGFREAVKNGAEYEVVTTRI